MEPLRDVEFHYTQLNIVTTCGMISSLLSCLQYFAFSQFYMREPWRIWQNWNTGIALVLLLTSDFFFVLVVVYVRRRFKQATPELFETGITKPLSWQVLLLVWYSGVFLICWSTWRVFVSYLCMNEVVLILQFV